MKPDEMRAKAKELFASAKQRLTDAALGAGVETQVAVTVDQTAATVLAMLADVVESTNPDLRAERAKKTLADFAAKNDAMRKAAARGFKSDDWSEFDRLVDSADGTGEPVAGNTVAGSVA